MATISNCSLGGSTNGSGVYNLTAELSPSAAAATSSSADGTASTGLVIQNGGVVTTTAATTYGDLWIGNTANETAQPTTLSTAP